MNDDLNEGLDQSAVSAAPAVKESFNNITVPLHTMQPPQLHTLHVLDTYLASILRNKQNGSNNVRISYEQCDINSIIQTCQFLFSQSSSSSSSHSSYSLLESALELLDDSSYHQNHDSSPSNSPLAKSELTPAVRFIRSSSGRCMIIVRGSSSSAAATSSSLRTSPISPSLTNNKSQTTRWRNRNSSNGNSSYSNKRKKSNQTQPSCSEYLITLGTNIMDTSGTFNDNDGGKNHSYDNGLGDLMVGKIGYHCTCRSFYERLKRPLNPNDRFVICKHLLAAKIAPFLHYEGRNEENDGGDAQQSQQHHGDNGRIICYKEEEVTDEEFAKMYVNLSMSLWT